MGAHSHAGTRMSPKVATSSCHKTHFNPFSTDIVCSHPVCTLGIHRKATKCHNPPEHDSAPCIAAPLGLLLDPALGAAPFQLPRVPHPCSAAILEQLHDPITHPRPQPQESPDAA